VPVTDAELATPQPLRAAPGRGSPRSPPHPVRPDRSARHSRPSPVCRVQIGRASSSSNACRRGPASAARARRLALPVDSRETPRRAPPAQPQRCRGPRSGPRPTPCPHRSPQVLPTSPPPEGLSGQQCRHAPPQRDGDHGRAASPSSHTSPRVVIEVGHGRAAADFSRNRKDLRRTPAPRRDVQVHGRQYPAPQPVETQAGHQRARNTRSGPVPKTLAAVLDIESGPLGRPLGELARRSQRCFRKGLPGHSSTAQHLFRIGLPVSGRVKDAPRRNSPAQDGRQTLGPGCAACGPRLGPGIWEKELDPVERSRRDTRWVSSSSVVADHPQVGEPPPLDHPGAGARPQARGPRLPASSDRDRRGQFPRGCPHCAKPISSTRLCRCRTTAGRSKHAPDVQSVHSVARAPRRHVPGRGNTPLAQHKTADGADWSVGLDPGQVESRSYCGSIHGADERAPARFGCRLGAESLPPVCPGESCTLIRAKK